MFLHREARRNIRFQSAPLTKARGDGPSRRRWHGGSRFQSAPLTKARGDQPPLGVQRALKRFNPLLSQKQGETRHPEGEPQPCAVSIRSSHKSKGRHGIAPDRYVQGGVSIRSSHKSKGRPEENYEQALAERVSIRSSHKSKGRPASEAGVAGLAKFQSAPLTKARGDTASAASTSSNMCFNPLLSQKQGETIEGDIEVPLLSVSIRSSHKSKGRQAVYKIPHWDASFQSAPLTKARGDVLFEPDPNA